MIASSGRIDGVVTRYQNAHHDSRRFCATVAAAVSPVCFGLRHVLYNSLAKASMAVSLLSKPVETRIRCGGTCEDGRDYQRRQWQRRDCVGGGGWTANKSTTAPDE